MSYRKKIVLISGIFLFSLFVLGVNINKNVFDKEFFAVNTSTSSVTRISLDKKNLNLSVGGTSKLNVSYTPNNVGSPELVWVSNNKSVVTVDNKGNVKAVGV